VTTGSGTTRALRVAASILTLALAASCGTRLGRPEASAEPRTAPAAVALPPAASAAASPVNPFAAEVRDLLVAPCGSCHLSTLETSKPAALAVFDLALDPWFVGMTAEQLEGLQRRVSGSDTIDEDAKAIVGRFVRCEADGGCR